MTADSRRIEALRADLHPDAQVRVEVYPGGALDVEIQRGEDLYVLQRTRAGECGISKIDDNEEPFMGHDAVFPDLEQALNTLSRWLGMPPSPLDNPPKLR
ncbi:MAG: hypothetical protein H6739_12010 [Alphaproteobacteria bacterium]|nr:hypothetical protein [Alphaproteobacteria bacterium]